MVQIPQYVQQEGLAAPSRDIPNVVQPTDGGIGQALSNLGGQITQVAEAAQARQQRMEEFNTRVSWDAFQEQQAQALTEMERNAQGDGAGLHDGFMKWRQENGEKFLASITNPELRQKYSTLFATSDAAHWGNQGANSEYKIANTYTVDQLTTAGEKAKLGIAQNPGSYEAQMHDMEERIKTAPNLTPEQRKKALDDLHEQGPKFLAAGLEQSDPETYHFLMGLGSHSDRIAFLTHRVIQAESGYDTGAESGKGASGIMQVMPDTGGVDVAKRLGDTQYLKMNTEQRKAFLKDPQNGLRYGQTYLAMMVEKYHGDVEAALVAYNAGPGNADKWLAAGRDYKALPKPQETQPYVAKILDGMGPAKYVSGAVSIDKPGAGPVYIIGINPEGMLKQGNIDLTTRPHVKNGNDTSTVRTISYQNDKGDEVLIPTVSDEGKIMGNDEAIAYWRKKGKNLGTFETPEAATAYAKTLHEQQAKTLTPAEAGGSGAPAGTSKPADPSFWTSRYQGRRQIHTEMNPEFGSRLQQAILAAEAATGTKVRITSLSRTNAEQRGAFFNYKRTGQGLAAVPAGMKRKDGTISQGSRHERGMAADIARGPALDWLHQHAGEFGLEFLQGAAFARDPVHIQLKLDGQGNQAPVRVADAAGTGGLSMNDANYVDGVPGGGVSRSGFVSPIFQGMSAADYLNMQHDAATGYAKAAQVQLSQDTADRILHDAGASTDAPGDRKAAYQALDAIGDAELKKDVAPLLDSHFNRWDAVKKDQAEKTLADTWGQVNAALDSNDTASAFAIIKKADIPQADRDKMLERVGKGAVQVDDPKTLQMFDAARFSNPRAFMDVNVRNFSDKLTEATIVALQEKQAKMREDAAKATSDQIKAQEGLMKDQAAAATSRVNLVNETFSKASPLVDKYFLETGIPTDAKKMTPADAEHANFVRSQVAKELEIQQQNSKTPLSITQIQDTVDAVMKTYPRNGNLPAAGSWVKPWTWGSTDQDVNLNEVLTDYGKAGLDPDQMANAIRKKGLPVNAQTMQQMLDSFNASKATAQ